MSDTDEVVELWGGPRDGERVAVWRGCDCLRVPVYAPRSSWRGGSPTARDALYVGIGVYERRAHSTRFDWRGQRGDA